MEMISEGVDFMIQRYVSTNWPFIRGSLPFIVTGPNFRRWTVPDSLLNFREHRFIPDLRRILETLDGQDRDLARESLAEFLLREGICRAIWSSNVRTVVPIEERWGLSIAQLKAEIPDVSPLSEWVIEMLSGLSDDSYYRNYLSESGIELKELIPPTEDV
jgi:hypothetical protein